MPGFLNYPAGRVTEIGGAAFDTLDMGSKSGAPNYPDLTHEPVSSGPSGFYNSAFQVGGAYGIDVTGGGVTGTDLGTSVAQPIFGQQEGMVDQSMLDPGYNDGGYQPAELDGESTWNGVEDMGGDWDQDQEPQAPPVDAPGLCAMTVDEWAAYEAQGRANEADAMRRSYWWLAGGAVAGFLAARLLTMRGPA